MSTDLELMRDLERAGAITPTSLRLPADTAYPRVEALFAYFGKVSHALRFYIGDLICWGEGRYSEKIYQAAEASGLTEGTLQNYASVCGRVAPDRRREGLSFAIHAEVAALTPTDQAKWLALAEEKGWTVRQLRELLRDEGLRVPAPQPAWSPLSGGGDRSDANGARGEPATGPAIEPHETRVALAPPPESGALGASGAPLEIHASVLATMRDELEQRIDRCDHPPAPEPIDRYERERDALNWALAHLAPELA